jgi:hypothetical protein
MAWDPDLQNSNQIYNNPYVARGYEKAKPRKLLLVVTGVVLAIIAVMVVIALMPESQQSKYTRSATMAARKYAPNAVATNVKVAGGFATALVSDPTTKGQANVGNTTIFKVNKDGSMVQLAKGNSFGPLDMLGLGVPLAAQAKLMGTSVGSVVQNLANQCGYSEGTIGYTGFDGSFNPGGWQIDSTTLSDLEQKLSNAIADQNANTKSGTGIICVNATQANSNDQINTTTYTSTFTLQVQFITNGGKITTHTVTFTVGSGLHRIYTLDGQDI